LANEKLIDATKNSKKEKRALNLYPSRENTFFYAKSLLKNADHFFNVAYQFDKDLIPALDPLPDGKYVQLFSGYFKIDRKNKIVIDTTKVAGVFTIKNNLLEGNAYWFNTVGDTLKQGKYLRGAKEGNWILKKEDSKYVNSKKEVELFCRKPRLSTVENNEFHSGAKNGIYIKESFGKIVTKGHFNDGKPDGEWFIYTSNFPDNPILTEHYTYSDQKTISHKPYIRDKFSTSYLQTKNQRTFPRIPDVNIDFSHFWICPPLKNPNFLEIDYPNYRRNYSTPNTESERLIYYNQVDIPRTKFIDSIGIINRYTDVYESFYPNGKSEVKLYFKNGDLIVEDTVFWSNGKPCDAILYHADKHEYENKKFDFNGKLIIIDIYDEKGAFLRKELDPEYADNHLTIDNLYPCAKIDNSYFWYFDKSMFYNPKYSENSIYYKRWFKDTTVNTEAFYNPNSKTITKINYSILGNKKSEETCQFSDKFESYKGITNAFLGDLAIQTISEGKIRGKAITQLDSINYINLTNRYEKYEITEKSTILYQNKPFSGKVEIDYRRNKIDYHLSKNKIKFFDGYGYKSKRKINKSVKKYAENKTVKNQNILQFYEIQISDLNFDYIFVPQLSAITTSRSPYILGQVDAKKSRNPTILKIEGNMVNGMPSGVWTTFGKHGKIVSTFTFSEGKLNGVAKKYRIQDKGSNVKYRTQNNILRYTKFPKKSTRYLAETIEFKDDELNGQYIKYDWQGKVVASTNIVNGMRNGMTIGRNPLTSTHIEYNEGDYNGSFKTYICFPGKDSLLLYDLHTKNGGFDGECKSFHLNGKLARSVVYKDGIPIEDYKSYDSLGNLFHTIHFKLGKPVEEIIFEGKQVVTKFLFNLEDSTFYEPFLFEEATAQSNDFNDGRNNLFYDYQIFNPIKSQHSKLLDGNRVDKEYNNYYLIKYFPNDNIAREGAFNDSKKNGLWKFYNYEGQKLYEINYFDSLITLNDSIEFKSVGEKFEYDLNGKLLSKSYVIEKTEKYDCSNSDHYEIRQFYTTWQANDTLKRINGYVKNYFDNGVIQSEGQMLNGLPTGVWKVYDPNGKLNMLGEYVFGKKQGRWLKGDLSKIKYLGEICLNPNLPDLEEQINYREKLLDIEIYYYKLGQRLNSEKYNLNLNKKEQFGDDRNYNRFEEEYEINSDIQLR
jgi:antitoxin component YwqK of YwqJK toxin-antitoxin module